MATAGNRVVGKGPMTSRVDRGLVGRISRLIGRNVGPGLTVIEMKTEKSSLTCREKTLGEYRAVNVRARIMRLTRSVARRSCRGALEDLGRGGSIRNVLYLEPFPGRLGRRTVGCIVSPRGSMSYFDPVGSTGVVRNSGSKFPPYAPATIMRVLGRCSIRLGNTGMTMLKEDVMINGPTTVLLLGRGTAIAVYRSEAGGLRGMASRTSVLMTTINETGVVGRGSMGRKTIMVSMNVGISRGKGLYKSISATSMRSGMSVVAPIPTKMNSIAASVLTGRMIGTYGGRGGGW